MYIFTVFIFFVSWRYFIENTCFVNNILIVPTPSHLCKYGIEWLTCLVVHFQINCVVVAIGLLLYGY